MKKLQVKNDIFYDQLSSKPTVDKIGITLSMCKRHNFETIFTSNDVLNIKYAIVKGFG